MCVVLPNYGEIADGLLRIKCGVVVVTNIY